MNAKPAAPAPTGGIPAPSVTHIRAVVKVPTAVNRFTTCDVAWLPSEGWFCGCEANTLRRPCVHVRLVIDAITGSTS